MYKKFLSILPAAARQRLRDTLEFQGGAMDSAFMKASSEETMFYKGPRARAAPASQARARVPSSEQSRIYDIGFYHRDPRTRLERERSITLEDAKLLHSARLEGKSTEEGIEAVMGHMAGTKRVMHPRLVDRVKDDDMIYDGSAGRKDPDVNRYSKDGLRSAMTTSWEATDKALWRERPDHTDRFAWQGDPSAVDRAIKASRRRSAYLGKEVAPMMERMPLKNVDGKRWQYYGRFV